MLKNTKILPTYTCAQDNQIIMTTAAQEASHGYQSEVDCSLCWFVLASYKMLKNSFLFLEHCQNVVDVMASKCISCHQCGSTMSMLKFPIM